MTLKLKKPITTLVVGTTTIVEYEVYADGTTGKPRVIKSYSYVPSAVKTPKKKKIKRKVEIQEEEVGTL